MLRNPSDFPNIGDFEKYSQNEFVDDVEKSVEETKLQGRQIGAATVTVTKKIIDFSISKQWISLRGFGRYEVVFQNCYFIGRCELNAFGAESVVFSGCFAENNTHITCEGSKPNTTLEELSFENNSNLYSVQIYADLKSLSIDRSIISTLHIYKPEIQTVKIANSKTQQIFLKEPKIESFALDCSYVYDFNCVGGRFGKFSLGLNNCFLNNGTPEYRQTSNIIISGGSFLDTIWITCAPGISEYNSWINRNARAVVQSVNEDGIEASLLSSSTPYLVRSLYLLFGFDAPIVNISFASCESISLKGINRQAEVYIISSALKNIYLRDLINLGYVEFSNIMSKERGLGIISIINSDLGKSGFKRWDMTAWGFDFRLSSISATKYYSTKLPQVSPMADGGLGLNGVYEASRQLRLMAEANSDYFQSVDLKASESKAFWEYKLLIGAKISPTDYAIWFSQQVNDYGRNWFYPLLWIAGFSFFWAWVIAWFEGCYYNHPIDCSLPVFWTSIKYLLVVPLFDGLSAACTGNILLIAFGKTINSIFYFQSITAFRKYFR